MAFVFEWLTRLRPSAIVLQSIVASVAAITALLVFIMARRQLRARYFARRERLRSALRRKWGRVLSGRARLLAWPFDPVAREVLESMLLERIERCSADDLPRLLDVLRRSGLMARRIEEARTEKGWRRWSALIALGRTRAAEAVAALSEALDSPGMETRIAAVRGMGKLGLPEAAQPMLERLADGRLVVPWPVLKNALLTCCASKPELLVTYLRVTRGTQRELLARVLGEIADSSVTEELLVLAVDPSAEVRAAAARGLAHGDSNVAILALAMLAEDAEWFVRLRAVVALAAFHGDRANAALIQALGDRNRQVRQRAACALMKEPDSLWATLRQVVDAGDNYGLQAVVTELERSGRYIQSLREIERTAGAEARRLITALETARDRLALRPRPAKEQREEVEIA